MMTYEQMGPVSVIFVATCHGLDGPGTEYPWGWDFPHPSRPSLRPTQPPIQWVPAFILGGKGDRDMALTTHPHLAPRFKKD